MQMNTAQTATPKTPEQKARTARGIALLRSTYKNGCEKIAAEKRAKRQSKRPNFAPHILPTGWFTSKDGVKIHA